MNNKAGGMEQMALMSDIAKGEPPLSMLTPLKRKRDESIQGPQIYDIFINTFIDILARSPEDDTIREYHSFFHVNESTQSAFLNSAILSAKREQFEFAKCLEGLAPHCQITVHDPQTKITYVFRFQPPGGIILHFRSMYCKMISPQPTAAAFNEIMQASQHYQHPALTLPDFRHIWQLLREKVRKWPDQYILHEKHMGGAWIPPKNVQSNNMFKRMGYTNLSNVTPVEPEYCAALEEALTRVENWRKREHQRCVGRLAEIEKHHCDEREAAAKENAPSKGEDKSASVQGPSSARTNGKLRRSPRFQAKK